MKNSGSRLGQRDANPKRRIYDEANGGEGHGDGTTGLPPSGSGVVFIQCTGD